MTAAAATRESASLRRRIQRQYATVEQTLQLGPLDLRFTRIADPDSVLDQVAAAADLRERLSGQRESDPQHLPYWAELWDSAIGMATYLAERTNLGEHVSVLDLGCGMGLTGTVAASHGCRVMFADMEADCLLFARLNAEQFNRPVTVKRPTDCQTEHSPLDLRPSNPIEPAKEVASRDRATNDLALDRVTEGRGSDQANEHPDNATSPFSRPACGASSKRPSHARRLNKSHTLPAIRARCLNWQRDSLAERFDLILGADILYDRKQWDFLEPFWRAHLAANGRVLLGEPGRPTGDDFGGWITPRGWAISSREIPVSTRPKPIRLFSLQKSD